MALPNIREAAPLLEGEAAQRRHMAIAPADPATFERAGRAAEERGDPSRACCYHGRAVALSPLARHWYDLGNALLMQGEPGRALRAFRRAVALAPAGMPFLGNAGEALARLGLIEAAIDAHRRATAVDPTAHLALANLAQAWTRLGQVGKAIRAGRTAVALAPALVAGQVNLGLALGASGDRVRAEVFHRRALAIESGSAIAGFALAFARLAAGDLVQGFRLYELRFRLPVIQRVASAPELPPWTGAIKPGLRLHLWCEQGFGDNIHFVRYAPLLADLGLAVTLQCPEPLFRLFRCLEPKVKLRSGDQRPAADAQAALMSLPGLLGTTLETAPARVPYLAVERPVPAEGPARQARKVGLAWGGSPEQMSDRMRSLSTEALRTLIRMIIECGAEPVSLQVGPRRRDLAEIPDAVPDWGQGFTDFADTARAIQDLDLVISVDSAVAHLAGALARPVWTLLAFVPEWRWLEARSDSPWYPTMRLFRQSQLADWSAVIDAVGYALRRRMAGSP